jgi:hypothetical protein
MVKSIEAGGIIGCGKLTNVKLGGDLTKIENWGFRV